MDDFAVAEKVNRMWLRLARSIERRLPDVMIDHGPLTAIRYATMVEACYWKATGEADTHSVNDVLK